MFSLCLSSNSNSLSDTSGLHGQHVLPATVAGTAPGLPARRQRQDDHHTTAGRKLGKTLDSGYVFPQREESKILDRYRQQSTDEIELDRSRVVRFQVSPGARL